MVVITAARYMRYPRYGVIGNSLRVTVILICWVVSVTAELRGPFEPHSRGKRVAESNKHPAMPRVDMKLDIYIYMTEGSDYMRLRLL